MFENIRLSFQGIFSHKIRSFLTMLGIIIGIAAIIAIVSTIKGTQEQIKNNLIGSGNNTVTVTLKKGDDQIDYQWEGVPDGVPVITKDVKKQIEDVEQVQSCTVYRYRSYIDSLFYKNKMLDSGSVYGIDEDYLDTAGYQIERGKGFSPADYKGTSKVCLVDDTVVASVFGDVDPIGKILDIRGEPFTVLGVVTESTDFEPVINSIEDYWMYNQQSGGKIYIPSEAWPIIFSYDEPQNVIAKAVDTDSMTQAGKKTADILNETLSVNDDSGIKYKSEDLLDQAKSLQDLSSSTNNMLIWIASISLLVGGIGVMNIMLVTVTERTREIGIRKALGAKTSTILFQFLTESVILCLLGGLIGLILGSVGAFAVASYMNIPIEMKFSTIVIAVGFSTAIGVFFGIYPARRAAKMQPIDALRSM